MCSNWEDPILDPAEISPVLIPELETGDFETNEL